MIPLHHIADKQTLLLALDEIIFLDLESHFTTDYSLTKLSTTEYIRDPRFYLQSIAATDVQYQIEYFDEQGLEEAIGRMQALTNDPDVRWAMVCHNTQFDAAVLKWRYGIEADWYFDTMAMSAGLYAGYPASLKEVCERLYPNDPSKRKGVELASFKGYRELTPAQHQTMKSYNVQDVRLCMEIFNTLLPHMPLSELYQIDMTVRMYINPMIRVDRPLMESCIAIERQENADKINDALAKVRDLNLDLDIDLDAKLFRSNPRFVKLLDAMGVTYYEKRNKNNELKPALSKKDVGWVDLKRENQHLMWLWEVREQCNSTLNLTRAERFLSCSNVDGNLLPVPLKYYGAHTGRLSGTDKINLQNLKRGSQHRFALRALEGYKMFVCDLSQIEARIVAWLADQHDLVDDFFNGVDIYSNFSGDVLYHERVTKADKERRNVGKTCILGLGYGMGWRTFQANMLVGVMGNPPLPCSDEFAKQAVYGYRSRFPAIPAAWKYVGALIGEMCHPDCDIEWKGMRFVHNAIILPNNMRLRYDHLQFVYPEDDDEETQGYYRYWNGKTWKKLYAGLLFENICQALAAVILKNQMATINQWATDHKLGSIVLQVHDEIILCAKPNEQFTADDIMAFMISTMSEAKDWYKNVPIACEGDMGDCYGDAK